MILFVVAASRIFCLSYCGDLRVNGSTMVLPHNNPPHPAPKPKPLEKKGPQTLLPHRRRLPKPLLPHMEHVRGKDLIICGVFCVGICHVRHDCDRFPLN